MNVAIYLRADQIKEIDENIAFWKERVLLYCKQRKYVPVIIVELSAIGETAEKYGLNKLEELFRKKYIAGIVTYDISMITQDMKKRMCFFNVLYRYNIRIDSVNQGILEKNFIKKIMNFSNHSTYNQKSPKVCKNLKEQFPKGSRVKLERIYSARGSGLTMGDLGTVLEVSNSGVLKIAWDILEGETVYLHSGVDMCQCVMSEKQIKKFLQEICKIPFQDIRRLEDWIELVLEPAFPYVAICINRVKKVIFADLGTKAFGREKALLEIKYKTRGASEIFVTRAKIKDAEIKTSLWGKLKRMS